MKRIGITGGIGSGKSTVADLLRLHGIPVYIADEESKKLTNSSPIIREKLIRLFGADLYTMQGLDKKKLASYIFGNEDLLNQVNQIIHPEVNRNFNAWCERQNKPLCAIESAILFESGFYQIVDIRLMVYTPLETRIQRALLRDHTTREALLQRINSQISDEEKLKRADFTIFNDGKEALLPQIEKFLQQYAKNIP